MTSTNVRGLRQRFARGIRLPLHLRLAGAIKRAMSWDMPLEYSAVGKSEGHRSDKRKLEGTLQIPQPTSQAAQQTMQTSQQTLQTPHQSM